jgi:8-oxo-dGTP pyrophosphatase MutT (NUDIX family)
MGKKGSQQVAALPWHRAGRALQVLLVTSRDTRRWVIPKGWPMDGRSNAQSARQEAFEEAGVTGAVGKRVLGQFSYDKMSKAGKARRLVVDVYPLRVTQVLNDWPELGERQRQWFAPETAAELVAEPDLQALLRGLKAAHLT